VNKKNITIIVCACLITAVLVGLEVYLWQAGPLRGFVPAFPVSVGSLPKNTSDTGTTTKPNTNFNEIKTKEEGIAACEANRSYAKTISDAEQKKLGEAMANYCYAIVAGKFNDLGLCNRTVDKNACEQTAKELIDMGREIQNLPSEEREQIQNMFKNLYKQQ